MLVCQALEILRRVISPTTSMNIPYYKEAFCYKNYTSGPHANITIHDTTLSLAVGRDCAR